MLDWFGFDEIPEHVRQYLNGRRSIGEVVDDLAVSPAKKLVTGFNPFWKLPTEAITRKSLFPDPGNPRTIRDLPDWMARQFNVEHEFRAITDRPAPPYWKSWGDLGVYRSDPDGRRTTTCWTRSSSSCRRWGRGPTRAAATPRGRRRCETTSSRCGTATRRGRALPARVRPAGRHARDAEGVAAVDGPLERLEQEEARAFFQWLTPEERARVGQAQRYYRRVLLGQDQLPPDNQNKRSLSLL